MKAEEQPTLPPNDTEKESVIQLDIETVRKMASLSHDAIETLFKRTGLLDPEGSLSPFPESQLRLNEDMPGPFGTHNTATGEINLRKNLTKESALIAVLHELVHHYSHNEYKSAKINDATKIIEQRGRTKSGFSTHTRRADALGEEHLRSFNEAVVQTTTIELLKEMQSKLTDTFPELDVERVLKIATSEIYPEDIEIFEMVLTKIGERRAHATNEVLDEATRKTRHEMIIAQFTGNTLPLIREIEEACGKGTLRIIGAGRSKHRVGEDQAASKRHLSLIKDFLSETDMTLKDDLAEQILGPFEYYQYVLHVHLSDVQKSLKNGSAEHWSASEFFDARHYVEEAIQAAKRAFKKKFDQLAAELLSDDETSRTKRVFLLESAGYHAKAQLEFIASNRPPATTEDQREFLSNLMLEQQIESLRETQATINNLLPKN